LNSGAVGGRETALLTFEALVCKTRRDLITKAEPDLQSVPHYLDAGLLRSPVTDWFRQLKGATVNEDAAWLSTRFLGKAPQVTAEL